MMYNWYGHGAGWEGWLMFLFIIVFVAAIVVAVVYLIRDMGQPQAAQTQALPPQQVVMAAPTPPAPESPQDILKRRYAAGEIDREEYLQKLGDL